MKTLIVIALAGIGIGALASNEGVRDVPTPVVAPGSGFTEGPPPNLEAIGHRCRREFHDDWNDCYCECADGPDCMGPPDPWCVIECQQEAFDRYRTCPHSGGGVRWYAEEGPPILPDIIEPCCARSPGNCPPGIIDCGMCIEQWDRDVREIQCKWMTCLDECWEQYPNDPDARLACFNACQQQHGIEIDCALSWWCFCTGQCPAVPLCDPPDDECE